MEKLEAVRRALAELGDVPSDQIAAFVAQQFGVAIDPRFVPVFKATVRDRQSLERTREAARATVAAAVAYLRTPAGPPPPSTRSGEGAG